MSEPSKSPLAVLREVLPPLILLGDYIGNEFAGKVGIEPFDRCAIIGRVRDAIEAGSPPSQQTSQSDDVYLAAMVRHHADALRSIYLDALSSSEKAGLGSVLDALDHGDPSDDLGSVDYDDDPLHDVLDSPEIDSHGELLARNTPGAVEKAPTQEPSSFERIFPREWGKIAEEAATAGSIIEDRGETNGGHDYDVHVPIGGGWDTRRYHVMVRP